MNVQIIFAIIALSCAAECRVDDGGRGRGRVPDIEEHVSEDNQDSRDAKLFNVFTVVRFKNDHCSGNNDRNGTCYTESECAEKNGQSSGSCAEGFGVCCVFVASCGQSVAENCTYFQSNGGEIGSCSLEICPCGEGICQMRLDFTTFIITGPSTNTATIGKSVAGVPTQNGAVTYGNQGQCLTDQFTVRTSSGGTSNPPTICGVNTGEHMYAEMDGNSCNTMDFQLGGTGIDATIPTRKWGIKVTQIDCSSNLRAPQGCTQYFYGSETDSVRSYNFNGGNGLHLANQYQNVCVRRERGNCKLCWSAVDPLDVDTNGKSASQTATLGTMMGMCCSYGTDGVKTKGYDCIMIPGAGKGTKCSAWSANALNANRFCGNSKGLATIKEAKTDAMSGTVCTKSEPYTIQFVTDNIETMVEALADATAGAKLGSGFQLAYFMSSNGC